MFRVGDRVLILVLLGAALTACAGQAEPVDQTAPVAEPNATLLALPTPEAGVQPTAGMISSGAAEAPATQAAPERPTAESGVRRAIHIREALQVLPFAALEPKALADGFFLDATQLIENPAGESLPGLPKMRLIYQGEPRGVIIIVQGPATGAAAEGEAVQVGEHAAWFLASPGPVLTWEQDGLRIEMRGNDVSREKMLEAAASMTPFAESGG